MKNKKTDLKSLFVLHRALLIEYVQLARVLHLIKDTLYAFDDFKYLQKSV